MSLSSRARRSAARLRVSASSNADERLGADDCRVRPLDAATFGSVVVVLATTAVASTIAPAWRAARVDSAVALRTE